MSARSETATPAQRKNEPALFEIDAGFDQMHRLAVIGTMTCAIAHELNNILTPILSYADLALRNPEDGILAQKAILRAQEGSVRASRIISSLLGLAGAGTDAAASCSLALALQNALKWVENDLVKKSVAIEFHVEPHHTVRMPGPALEQVLTNLMLNAIRAAPEGRGELSISASREQRGGGTYTLIRIQDNGGGIPSDLVGRVFEPFVKGPAPTGTRLGSGLGLAVCRKLLTDAKGTIEIEHTSSRGTTFLLTVPA